MSLLIPKNLMKTYSRHKLIQFIREEIGEFKMQIDSNTTIEDDLGVTGDEAIELIQKIAKEFSIDISEFEYEKYFHPEPGIFRTFGTIKPLTIQNLEDGIKTGKLM
jgi:acyl carrier protein